MTYYYIKSHRTLRSHFHKTCEDRQEQNKFRKEACNFRLRVDRSQGRRPLFFRACVFARALHLNSMFVAFVIRRDRYFSLTKGGCLWLARENARTRHCASWRERQQLLSPSSGSSWQEAVRPPRFASAWMQAVCSPQPYAWSSSAQLFMNTNRFSLLLFVFLFFFFPEQNVECIFSRTQ